MEGTVGLCPQRVTASSLLPSPSRRQAVRAARCPAHWAATIRRSATLSHVAANGCRNGHAPSRCGSARRLGRRGRRLTWTDGRACRRRRRGAGVHARRLVQLLLGNMRLGVRGGKLPLRLRRGDDVLVRLRGRRMHLHVRGRLHLPQFVQRRRMHVQLRGRVDLHQLVQPRLLHLRLRSRSHLHRLLPPRRLRIDDPRSRESLRHGC